MNIEVLGPGCPRCNQLGDTARVAANKLGITHELTHVTDITELVRRGVMMTPALVIDGEVMICGRVPDEAEITAMLETAVARGGSA